MAHGRSYPLLIMPLALALTGSGLGQMLPVSPSTDSGAVVSATSDSAGGGPLYVSVAPAEPAMAGAAGASRTAVTLAPRAKRVHDLPDIRTGDRVRSFRAVAFAVTASTLGAGAEMALPMTPKLNMRLSGNYLNWQPSVGLDGISYTPQLKFVAGTGTVDWFPHGNAFHVSVGALYFHNIIAGNASVGVGQSFTLGGTTYINSVDDPVGGTAQLSYGKRTAPMLLLGFGNLLPRNGAHVSMPIEFGGAYMQPPTVTMHLAGTACTSQGCFNAATSEEIQTNLKDEESKLQDKLQFLKIYPIVSLGLSCRF